MISGITFAWNRIFIPFISGIWLSIANSEFGRTVAKRFDDGHFHQVGSVFFTEAAVLVFVFPVVDTVVQFGPKSLTLKLGAVSLVASVVFYLLAVILSKSDEH